MRGGKCCFEEKRKRERSRHRRHHIIIKTFRGCAYELVYISDVSVFLTYGQQDYQQKEALFLRLRALNIQAALCAQLESPLAFLLQIKLPSYALSSILVGPRFGGGRFKFDKTYLPCQESNNNSSVLPQVVPSLY